MTESRRDPGRSSGVDDIRAELGDELMRAARADRPPGRLPRGRRLVLSLAAVVLAVVPARFAVAELLPDEEPLPAPPPLFAPGGEFAECPVEVRESLLKLERLSDYPETPGYPVAGCPTLEQIQENEAAAAELERHYETFERLAR